MLHHLPCRGARIGFGGVFFVFNVALLTGFSISCNSFRHLVGGRLDCFSCSRRNRAQYTLWQRISALNRHHMGWAWASLITVTLADVYVRLLALGVISLLAGLFKGGKSIGRLSGNRLASLPGRQSTNSGHGSSVPYCALGTVPTSVRSHAMASGFA